MWYNFTRAVFRHIQGPGGTKSLNSGGVRPGRWCDLYPSEAEGYQFHTLLTDLYPTLALNLGIMIYDHEITLQPLPSASPAVVTTHTLLESSVITDYVAHLMYVSRFPDL